ncbi:MAG TPA: DUF4199 domain-containing protein [Bacteroidales bacterium]|nr:DUF4199 domain-containing protein [Bacteroidales bacterium]
MKNFQISVKFGLITGLVLILYSVIIYLTNVNIFSPMVSITNMLVNFVFLIVMAVLAIRKTRDEAFGGKISYSNALIAGFLLMLVSGYLGALYNYVFATAIDPGYISAQMSNFIDSMEGKLPEDALDKMIDSIEENINPSRQLMRSAWITPIFALVVSAIAAAAIKKDTTNEFPA